MMSIRVTGAREGAARWAQLQAKLHAQLVAVVHRETLELQRAVVSAKLSGQVLHVRSGTLRRSITSHVDESGHTIRGIVGTNVEYAHIHEYGGTLNIPEVRPVTARALHWVSAGESVFAMRARAHSVTIPERSFLRSALADRAPAIRQAVRAALLAGVRAGLT